MTINSHMRFNKYFFCSVSVLLAVHVFGQRNYSLRSPDRKIQLQVQISDSIHWKLSNGAEVLVDAAVAGLQIEGQSFVGYKEQVKSAKITTIKQTITAPVAIRDKYIDDQYNELRLDFKSSNALIFRAYDNGVAYRWVTRFKDSIKVDNEVVELHFPQNNQVFWGTDKENSQYQSHYEQMFQDTTVASYSSGHFCPLPLYMASTYTKMIFTEADLLDYANLFLRGTGSNSLKSGFPKVILKQQLVSDRGIKVLENADYIAKTKGTRSFPWRVVMVANQDKDLLENNLVYQLATPNALKETDWIKPGKVSWDWWNDNNIYGVDFRSGINNNTYKYYIDFAAAYRLEYIILDEGWSLSTWDLTHPNKDIDVAELVRYGKQKGVDVILWALWQPMDKNMDEILDTYVQWGVKGVKVDFMARADQYMVNFYERLAKAAAKRKLLVDLHGAYKPVGLNRTYPNIISYEGVKGLENYKWSGEEANPKHDVTIPFTRMVVGPMDYTPGAMHNATKRDFRIVYDAPMSEGTRAHQVAMYAVYESPLQMLADNPSNYKKDSIATRYIASFPTTWEKTVALDGKIGDYIAVARQHGNKWYVGAMTSWDSRDLTIKLDFLSSGRKYQLQYFADGINADKMAEDYKIGDIEVVTGQIVKVHMAPGGGWSAIISEK